MPMYLIFSFLLIKKITFFKNLISIQSLPNEKNNCFLSVLDWFLAVSLQIICNGSQKVVGCNILCCLNNRWAPRNLTKIRTEAVPYREFMAPGIKNPDENFSLHNYINYPQLILQLYLILRKIFLTN